MRENIQKIEVDYDKRIIKCGDIFELKSYIQHLDWKYVSSECGYSVGKNGKGSKERNKKVSEMLGMPPKRYAKMLRGIQYKLWLKDYKELIFKLCTRHSHRHHIIQEHLVNHFYNNLDVINEYKNDNLYNLIPFAFYRNKTTQELKKEYGKTLWKSLCKNSFTRNKLICGDVYCSRGNIEQNNSLSSSILKNKKINLSNHASVSWLNNFLIKERALTTKKHDIERLLSIADDTRRMSGRINKSFNINWSLKKLEQKHREYTLSIEQEQYPDTFIENLKSVPVKEFKDEQYTQYTATLIDTPYKIKKQGIEQGHCVASYVNYVCKSEYIIYDIKENNKTVSTLGIRRDDNKYSFSQHYGKYNEKVCVILSYFAIEIIKELNKGK